MGDGSKSGPGDSDRILEPEELQEPAVELGEGGSDVVPLAEGDAGVSGNADPLSSEQRIILKGRRNVRKKTFASMILKRTRNEKESAEKPLKPWGIDIGQALDLFMEGDSKTIGRRFAELDNFFGKRAVSHEKAMDIVNEKLQFEEKVEGRDDIVERVYNQLPPEMLYPAATSEDLSAERGKRGIQRRMNRKLDEAKEPFKNTPLFLEQLGKDTPIAAMLECPRAYGHDRQVLKSLGVRDDELGPEGALLDQTMCLRSSRYVLSYGEGHRASFLLGQRAVLISEVVGCQTRLQFSDREFSTPSLSLFPERNEKTTEKVRRHIDAMLSLMMPDRGEVESLLMNPEGTVCLPLVQEDFISVDLMALAQEHGLAEEYAEVFDNLYKLRNVLHLISYHLTPSFGREHPGGMGRTSKRMSLIDVIHDWVERHDGELPTIGSLGYGNGILEQLLLKMGLVSSVIGTEVHDDESDADIVTFPGDSDLELVRIPRERSVATEEGVFGHLKGDFDIVIACDALHETPDPPGFNRALWGRVNPGGNLYVSDPVHCRSVDGVTVQTLHKYDLTRDPASIRPVEASYNSAAHLALKGAQIISYRGVVPGVHAGSNDLLPRLTMAYEKGDVVPFGLPEESIHWDEEIQTTDDLFEVFPLCEVPIQCRDKVVERLEVATGIPIMQIEFPLEIENVESVRGMNFADIKYRVLAWLIDSVSPERVVLPGSRLYAMNGTKDVVEGLINAKSPHGGDYLNKMFESVGNDSELMTLDRYAGEVIALVYALRDICEVDISESVKRHPNWERLLMDDASIVNEEGESLLTLEEISSQAVHQARVASYDPGDANLESLYSADGGPNYDPDDFEGDDMDTDPSDTPTFAGNGTRKGV